MNLNTELPNDIAQAIALATAASEGTEKGTIDTLNDTMSAVPRLPLVLITSTTTVADKRQRTKVVRR